MRTKIKGMRSDGFDEYIKCTSCPDLDFNGFCVFGDSGLYRNPEAMRRKDRDGRDYCLLIRATKMQLRKIEHGLRIL